MNTILEPENTLWRRPEAAASGTGVLVVAGSSGRIDIARVTMLAEHGVTALGLRWFGGPGLPQQAREIPLEHFFAAVQELRSECDRVVLMGLSYGAEAMLLTAAHGPPVEGIIALAPTHVAWEGDRARGGDAPRSKWSLHGSQLPHVPLDRKWVPPTGPAAFVGLYESSLSSAEPAILTAASIPVERIAGDVVVVAGGEDQVWPSARSAEQIASRRRAAGLATTVVVDERAGHPIVLPGEVPASSARPYAVGGDAGAPERLGRAAWPAIAQVLQLREK